MFACLVVYGPIYAWIKLVSRSNEEHLKALLFFLAPKKDSEIFCNQSKYRIFWISLVVHLDLLLEERRLWEKDSKGKKEEMFRHVPLAPKSHKELHATASLKFWWKYLRQTWKIEYNEKPKHLKLNWRFYWRWSRCYSLVSFCIHHFRKTGSHLVLTFVLSLLSQSVFMINLTRPSSYLKVLVRFIQ